MLAGRNETVRYFTVREMARLQGFPDDFSISGTWKAATRQLGNAVPTTIGERMADAILKVITRNRRAITTTPCITK
jgi:DNA (cytosine-5)-methyltransferase 1